jgi:hypothetical protein
METTEKICPVCGVKKPLTEYTKRTSIKQPYTMTCKECLSQGYKGSALTVYIQKIHSNEILTNWGYDLSNLEENSVYSQFLVRMKEKYGKEFNP